MPPTPRTKRTLTTPREVIAKNASPARKTPSRPSIQRVRNPNGWAYFMRPNGQPVGMSKSGNVNVHNYIRKIVSYANSRIPGKFGCSKVQLASLNKAATIALSLAINDISTNSISFKDRLAKPLAIHGAGANEKVWDDLILAATIDALRIPPYMISTILDSADLVVASASNEAE